MKLHYDKCLRTQLNTDSDGGLLRLMFLNIVHDCSFANPDRVHVGNEGKLVKLLLILLLCMWLIPKTPRGWIKVGESTADGARILLWFKPSVDSCRPL